MPPPLELLHGRLRKTAFDIEQVARISDIEAARQPARHLDRLLDVETEIDEAYVTLQVDLRLAIRAHAAEHLPGPALLECDRRDEGMHRALARLEAVGGLRIERETRPAGFPHDAPVTRDHPRAENAAEDLRPRVEVRTCCRPR